MLKKILLGLAALVVIFLVIVALQPNEYRVARSAAIAAAPEQVFAHVNDFHNWEAWSPWAKLDPNAKATSEGPRSGEGAVFIWAGNDEVGEGPMTLTQSRPSELIRIRLDFVKPMESTSDVEFTFKPQGNQTDVTWAMSGRHTFISKAICLVVNQDRMLGGYFEKGLASLKAVVERPRRPERRSLRCPTARQQRRSEPALNSHCHIVRVAAQSRAGMPPVQAPPTLV